MGYTYMYISSSDGLGTTAQWRSNDNTQNHIKPNSTIIGLNFVWVDISIFRMKKLIT